MNAKASAASRRTFLKQMAAAAFHNIGKEAAPAVPVLIKALQDPDPELRKHAAFALGHLPRCLCFRPVLVRGWGAVGNAIPHFMRRITTLVLKRLTCAFFDKNSRTNAL